MRPDMDMVIVLTLLAFAGIQARIFPDYPNDQSLTKANNGGTGTSSPDATGNSSYAAAENQHLTSRSVTYIVCKWLIDVAISANEINLCDKVVISADLGRTPRPAPPSPRPPPGSRPLVAY
ncbi:hypothetical protein Pfo_011874 [Paulownia fortunei]|nr:hypothetical protein Pfo_011874 [Paulownia fortunei]